MKDGIVKGYSDGTFKPSKSVTRAEFAVMLANALKLQEAVTELSFKDASQIGAWAKAAVASSAASWPHPGWFGWQLPSTG